MAAEKKALFSRYLSDHLKKLQQCAAALLMLAIGCPVLAQGNLAESGAIESTSKLGGTYGVVGTSEGIEIGGFTRALSSGTLEINAASATFSLETRVAKMNLIEVCDVKPRNPDACNRLFVRTRGAAHTSYEGSYQVSADASVLFDAISKTFRGFVNPQGTVIMIPVNDAAGVTLLFAIKKGKHLSPRLVDGQYAFSARAAAYPEKVESNHGKWESYTSEIRQGSISIADLKFTGQAHGSLMTSETACKESTSGCNVFASLSAASAPSINSSGDVLFSRRGLLRFDITNTDADDNDEQDLHGFVTDDGDFAALLEDGTEAGRQGLELMTRVGQGMSSATVSGAYNAAALEEFFESEGSIRNAFVSGPIAFDGAQAWQFTGTDSSTKRAECQRGGVCPSAGLSSRTVAGGAGGKYSVKPSGEIVVSGIAGDNTPRLFVGNVSQDGSVIVLRRVGDNDPCSFDCVGVESFRSIIIAIRR